MPRGFQASRISGFPYRASQLPHPPRHADRFVERALYGNGSRFLRPRWCDGVCLAPSADALPSDACLRVPGGTIAGVSKFS